MTEDEWSLILAEMPGLKRIIEENEAFERAQFWGGLFRASEAYFVDDGGDADSGEAPVGDVLCMVRSSWGSVDARVAPLMVLCVVLGGVALFMVVVSLFMFVGGVVFGG